MVRRDLRLKPLSSHERPTFIPNARLQWAGEDHRPVCVLVVRWKKICMLAIDSYMVKQGA